MSPLGPSDHSNTSCSSKRTDSPLNHILSPGTSQSHSDLLYYPLTHSQVLIQPSLSHSPQYLQPPQTDPFELLSHIDTSELSDQSLISPSSAVLEPDSATSVSSGVYSPSDLTPTPTYTSKQRRKRTKINLAPDQPLTTQGKPRTRVFSACLQWWVSHLLILVCFDISFQSVAVEKLDAMVVARYVTTALEGLATIRVHMM
jgi:hypothetical protein